MKRTKTQTIWFFITLISFITRLLIPYLEGRSNSLWVIPPLLPVDLLPFLFLLLSCIVLLSLWVRSMLAKCPTVAATSMSLTSLLLLAASFTIRPAECFHCGFRDYVEGVLTIGEWRAIAQFAQAHLPPEGKLPGPRKNLWNENDHRALWSALAAATQIQKLDPSLVIFVIPERTELMWGSALVGHRGVVISSAKNETDQRGGLSRTMFVAEDIATFMSAD
jgi:hypothetical protein